MRYFATALTLLAVATTAQGQLVGLCPSLVLVRTGATTNDFITPNPFDVYRLNFFNPNDMPVTSLEINLPGDFLGLGNTTFKAGPENPVLFGFEAPDTFFVLPDGVDPSDVLAVNTVDTSTRLASSFTVAGGADLVPAKGSAPIATISVPAGVPFERPEVLGRAAIGGVFVNLLTLVEHPRCIPEPTAGVLACLALAGAAVRRSAHQFVI